MKFSADFGEFLYNRLPEIYREADAGIEQNLVLKRFLDTLNSGGFKTVIDDLNGLNQIIDLDTIPSEYLPYMGNLLGYDYKAELPDWFQRRLLKTIVDLYKRKGTKSSINYLARELSGFETEVIENRDFTQEEVDMSGWENSTENRKNFILKLRSPLETSMLKAKEDAVKLVLKDYLPVGSQVLVVTVYWFEDTATMAYYTETISDMVTITELSEQKSNTSGTTESIYDIITNKEGEDNNIYLDIKNKDENYLTNALGCLLSTNFLTNSLPAFDTIKVSGQPDQIIYY